jgi:hypothetical protein
LSNSSRRMGCMGGGPHSAALDEGRSHFSPKFFGLKPLSGVFCLGWPVFAYFCVGM